MSLLQFFTEQLQHEATVTRKMLSLVPNDKFDWAPHEKSMKMGVLATHVADLPNWIPLALTTIQLDFADNNYPSPEVRDTRDLLRHFDKSQASAIEHLQQANESELSEFWTLRNSAEVYSTEPKSGVIRMAISQIIHHRAQLGVYLRLLNIPIPGSYGPSADEMNGSV